MEHKKQLVQEKLDQIIIGTKKIKKNKKNYLLNNQKQQKYDKAVIVHTRDAINDSYEILKEYGKGLRIDIHCFAGSVEMANKFIGLGAVLGIGGVLTFKNAKKFKKQLKRQI